VQQNRTSRAGSCRKEVGGVTPADFFSEPTKVTMAKAIEQIVETHVRYTNRAALENLRSHRRKIRFDIKSRSSAFDSSQLVGQIDEEIASINAGPP